MRKTNYVAAMIGACLLAATGNAQAQATPAVAAKGEYKPTVEDWVGVNDAVDNYTLGLERHDMARFDRAFWPEATIIAQPEPDKSFTMPYRMAAEGPPPPPPPGSGAGAPPPVNAIGSGNPPWHLSLSHHFEFQGPTRATHYGYFVSVYPDLKTKISVVGLPGHYEDVLEKRGGEWRILQRKTVIGAK